MSIAYIELMLNTLTFLCAVGLVYVMFRKAKKP
jgi:cell division protein FtsL